MEGLSPREAQGESVTPQFHLDKQKFDLVVVKCPDPQGET